MDSPRGALSDPVLEVITAATKSRKSLGMKARLIRVGMEGNELEG